MELDQFIEKSLMQICKGVRSAQNKAFEETGNYPIAPAYMEGKAVYEKWDQVITFDVTVSVNKDKNLHVNAGFAGVGGKGDLAQVSSNIQRIQFSVPFYPQALNGKAR